MHLVPLIIPKKVLAQKLQILLAQLLYHRFLPLVQPAPLLDLFPVPHVLKIDPTPFACLLMYVHLFPFLGAFALILDGCFREDCFCFLVDGDGG